MVGRRSFAAVDELEGEDEHEAMKALINEDDRHDTDMLQGAGESGDFDSPYPNRPQTRPARMDRRAASKATTSAKLPPRKMTTEGP